MRLTSLLAIIFLCGTATFAQQKISKYVQPTQDNIGIYANEIRQVYEKALVTLPKAARLEVLETKKEYYKVSYQGQVGYVEKRLVQAVAKGANRTYTFGDEEVLGSLDNPTPIYIMDAEGSDPDPIKLDRSFSDALKENVDMETVLRQTK
jgi:hypothetical protein